MFKSVLVTLAAVLAIAAGKPSVETVAYTQPAVTYSYSAPVVKQYVPQTYTYATAAAPVVKYSTPVSYKSYVPVTSYTAPAVASYTSVAPVASVAQVAPVARVAPVAAYSAALTAPVYSSYATPLSYAAYPYSNYAYPKFYSGYNGYETYAPISYSYDPSSPFYWKRK